MPGIDGIQFANNQKSIDSAGPSPEDNEGDTAELLAKELNGIKNYISNLREQLLGDKSPNKIQDNNNTSELGVG